MYGIPIGSKGCVQYFADPGNLFTGQTTQTNPIHN